MLSSGLANARASSSDILLSPAVGIFLIGEIAASVPASIYGRRYGSKNALGEPQPC